MKLFRPKTISPPKIRINKILLKKHMSSKMIGQNFLGLQYLKMSDNCYHDLCFNDKNVIVKLIFILRGKTFCRLVALFILIPLGGCSSVHVLRFVLTTNLTVCLIWPDFKITFDIYWFCKFDIGTSGRRSSRLAFGWSTGNDVSEHYIHKQNYFLFLFLLFLFLRHLLFS